MSEESKIIQLNQPIVDKKEPTPAESEKERQQQLKREKAEKVMIMSYLKEQNAYLELQVKNLELKTQHYKLQEELNVIIEKVSKKQQGDADQNSSK